MKLVPWKTVVAFMLVSGLGCGQSNQTILPTGELTAEQQAAVASEYQNIEEQESQGKINSIGIGKAKK